MSARLKLKKLQKQIADIERSCWYREYEAMREQRRCRALLEKNICEIQTYAEFYPIDTMRNATQQLDYNVNKVADAIVRKYTEHLAEYIRNQLVTEYRLTKFSMVAVTLLASALSEEHIKVELNARHKY